MLDRNERLDVAAQGDSAATEAPADTAQAELPKSDAPYSGSHLGFLDGVRGIAALYVVFHHIWLTSYPGFPRDTGPRWASWMLWGHLAVAVFIVVSGFSLSLGPLRHGDRLPLGFWIYIKRRAFRILPPYWVALVFSCLVIVLFVGKYTGETVNLRTVLVHGTLLQDVVDTSRPNGAFWSIAVEWQLYFLLPLLLLLWRMIGGVLTLCVTTAAVVVSQALGTGLPAAHKLLDLTPQFLALFAFGVAGAHVLARPERFSRVPWLWVGATLVVIALVWMLWWDPESVVGQYFWVDMLVGAAAAALFAGWAQRPRSRLARALSGPVPHWLGQSSYSLYLVHVPIISIVYWGLVVNLTSDNEVRFLLLLLFGVPTAVIGARLFWWWFERPFMLHRTFRGLKGAWRTTRTSPVVTR